MRPPAVVAAHRFSSSRQLTPHDGIGDAGVVRRRQGRTSAPPRRGWSAREPGGRLPCRLWRGGTHRAAGVASAPGEKRKSVRDCPCGDGAAATICRPGSVGGTAGRPARPRGGGRALAVALARAAREDREDLRPRTRFRLAARPSEAPAVQRASTPHLPRVRPSRARRHQRPVSPLRMLKPSAYPGVGAAPAVCRADGRRSLPSGRPRGRRGWRRAQLSPRVELAGSETATGREPPDEPGRPGRFSIRSSAIVRAITAPILSARAAASIRHHWRPRRAIATATWGQGADSIVRVDGPPLDNRVAQALRGRAHPCVVLGATRRTPRSASPGRAGPPATVKVDLADRVLLNGSSMTSAMLEMPDRRRGSRGSTWRRWLSQTIASLPRSRPMSTPTTVRSPSVWFGSLTVPAKALEAFFRARSTRRPPRALSSWRSPGISAARRAA